MLSYIGYTSFTHIAASNGNRWRHKTGHAWNI